MEQFKGTKGKWFVWREDIVITKEDVEGDVICIKPQMKNSQKNWEANALLISKAPEMLEMLLRLIDRMEENDLGNFHSVKMAKELIKEATEL